MRRHIGMIFGVVIMLGILACSRPEGEKPEPPLPKVEIRPPEPFPAGPVFRGQNADAWQKQPFQTLNLPDFLLLDSLWRAVQARNDTIWTLTTPAFADTVVFPPLPWRGEGCQQAVDLPLLLFPSTEIRFPQSPLEIHIQVRTDRDPEWRETRRWGSPFWIYVREVDTSYVPGCMQEGPLGDTVFLWGGSLCWGEFDPVPGDSIQIRLILRGGDVGVSWTVGLWGAGWRWRSPGQEVWDLQWSGLPKDFGVEVTGVPCSGRIWIRGRVMRGETTVADTFFGLFYLPAPFNERYETKKPKVVARGLPALGETLHLVASVNAVEKETTLILPRNALVPAETLLHSHNPPVSPLGLTEEGVLMQRLQLPDGVTLERWRWTGGVDTLVDQPALSYSRFREAAYDRDDPSLVVGVPYGVSGPVFVVFHPGGFVLDTLRNLQGEIVDVVDLPGKHRFRVVTLMEKYDWGSNWTELWSMDIRWDGQHLLSDTLRKLTTWTHDDVSGPSVEAFSSPDTGWDTWAVSLWDSCAVEFYEGGRLVATAYHCPVFWDIFWDPDGRTFIGYWLENTGREVIQWAVRFDLQGF